MKKLFLASYAAQTLNLAIKLFPKPVNELTAAFIPTAADPYLDKKFVEVDRNKLVTMGFKVIDLDLKKMNPTQLESSLSNTDLVLVAGGNTFYLLDWIKKSGFNKVLPTLLDRGLIYVGSSAGSIVCCPTTEGAISFDDPKAAPDLTDYAGLNLIGQVIIPHAQKEKYAQRIIEAEKEMKKMGFETLTITDDQAVMVINEEVEVVNLR